MFKLFASIFSGSDKKSGNAIPENLLKAAIEHALDRTDPRMRILPDYAKVLRKPVEHAAEHIIAMVDALPPAILATQGSRDESPALSAIFTSAERMNAILSQDVGYRDYLTTLSPKPEHVFGLLVVDRHEKTGFGYALVEDKLMNDVQRTTISFDNHRLVDLSITEEEIRPLLRRRTYDYLLSIALAHISEQKDEREKLTQQRALLRVKLEILQKGGSSFSSDMGPQDRTALQTRMNEVEEQLTALGPVNEVLQNNLAIVADVLNNAEKHFWDEETSLRIDNNYVLRQDAENNIPPVLFRDVCDSNGRRLTLLLLLMPTDVHAGSY